MLLKILEFNQLKAMQHLVQLFSKYILTLEKFTLYSEILFIHIFVVLFHY